MAEHVPPTLGEVLPLVDENGVEAKLETLIERTLRPRNVLVVRLGIRWNRESESLHLCIVGNASTERMEVCAVTRSD